MNNLKEGNEILHSLSGNVYKMVKSNSKTKRKSDKISVSCELNGLNKSKQIQGKDLTESIMKDPKRTNIDRSLLHRAKVNSVGGESIMLILLLLPLSGNLLNYKYIIPIET